MKYIRMTMFTTRKIPATDSVRKEFTFDKVGQYELICIIYGHKRDGMYGTILVE